VVKNPWNHADLVGLVPAAREYDLLTGKPTAFVCRGFTCLAPVQTAAGLEELLAALSKG
jgi:uncharacterized protein YyaL (SSP411 family)